MSPDSEYVDFFSQKVDFVEWKVRGRSQQYWIEI
ncbi:hypothetical protein ISN44_As05g023890 [Arabidopsis suecica]|uniref:Uncharacterized protein n=1 Tax=Arabidopsis suecica TaxID=45249 RepID=A0A8T2DFP4_ARASU|nr:hypothetical protein ISN44_As05g023890 [Arabidopsis suecica]